MMIRYLKSTTTGQILVINQKEAEQFVLTANDQSITFSRIEACVQKRLWELIPLNNSDLIQDRKKQQTGILHDGSRAKKRFGLIVADLDDVPDDKGNPQPVNLNPQEYPEARTGIIATEEEWKEIQKTGADYYEFLGISNKIKRIDNKDGFTKLIE